MASISLHMRLVRTFGTGAAGRRRWWAAPSSRAGRRNSHWRGGLSQTSSSYCGRARAPSRPSRYAISARPAVRRNGFAIYCTVRRRDPPSKSSSRRSAIAVAMGPACGEAHCQRAAGGGWCPANARGRGGCNDCGGASRDGRPDVRLAHRIPGSHVSAAYQLHLILSSGGR